ncbi:MAG TPA: hypothetical protein VGX70_04745 [Gemmataceae bacterium]|jgi:hypothetical protein|nr:hypothetical protein [Gemmataceae bacterium]
MRFWIREILGWFLVGLGLFAFYMCVVLLFNHSIIEVGPLFVIGIVVFRGGIHLLKVAVAARICMEAQAKMPGGSATPVKAKPKQPLFGRTLTKTSLASEPRKPR